jgi:hypothetical protein
MPRAARGRFQPSGKRLQLSRQYNVSIDTGAFEIPQSSSRAPDASTLQSVEVRPARKHLHAQPVPCVPVRAFLGWRRARAGTAVPIPSRARSLTYACITPLVKRLEHARMTLHAHECACERKAHVQPDSFAVTGVLCAIALVANMPHTYDDPCRLAHARMIQQANTCARGLKTHAQRAFVWSLWALVSQYRDW